MEARPESGGGRIEREKEKLRGKKKAKTKDRRKSERKKNRVWEGFPGEEREEKREGIKEREEREE